MKGTVIKLVPSISARSVVCLNPA